MKKEWKLPKPEDTGGTLVYHPVVRVGRIVPFGYKQDPDDPDILLPIQKELELLEQAKRHLKQYSLRAVADWLSTESGRSISYVGLRGRIKLEQQRQSNASNQRYLAKRYEEALKKAEKLESQRIGGRGLRSSEDVGDTEASSD
jgi:hypothetical protein